MTPNVSVILPAYNVAPYVPQSIRSVLDQTFEDFEILAVDDGSTDNTRDIILGFSDPRIRQICNQRNLGLSSSRNIAIEQARGEWLAILDADDWWAPERLSRLLDIGGHECADFVADDMAYVPDGQKEATETLLTRRKLKLKAPVQVTAVLFTEWDLGLVKPLIRKEFLEKTGIRYDESSQISEDFPFQLRCLLHNPKYIFVPEAYYYYRIRAGSISSKRIQMFGRARDLTDGLLQEKTVIEDRALTQALKRRKRYLAQVVAYNEVKDMLTKRRLLPALFHIARFPGTIPFTLKRIPRLIRKK